MEPIEHIEPKKKMNPEVKAKWVAALRSGEYQQGTGALKSDDKYCCLGVLCDIFAKETGKDWTALKDSPVMEFDGATGLPPNAVSEWAGLQTMNPIVLEGTIATTLSNMNDGLGASFQTIARLIEEQL